MTPPGPVPFPLPVRILTVMLRSHSRQGITFEVVRK